MGTNSSTIYRVKLVLCCLFAVGANFLLTRFKGDVLALPLYLDTLFTCAVTFAAGLLPGICTAVLTATTFPYIFYGVHKDTLFVLCSIAEVLLIWSFRRRLSEEKGAPVQVSFVNKVAVLFILAVFACLMESLLGGVIDYFLFNFWGETKFRYSPEDRFKLGLLRNNMPLLWASIISRLPINIVDRFIVIFGGYSVSLGIRKFFRGR
ncbi:hypothetical protein TREPR_3522 [Treponema primitia ZAS-2]|uniref:ECF transporter S component n=1 Tax=Treponema primitia (strain ATCC BAA-887 / DSM 12427 / ZAS-2) TaxID=545694 RepID=F5YIV1_TREPZ|nr:hypothetical protein [Treponema primitia]AEF85253.1 hypothetical protein TREPR_3522 [Treponema primitia ZAS-2]